MKANGVAAAAGVVSEDGASAGCCTLENVQLKLTKATVLAIIVGVVLLWLGVPLAVGTFYESQSGGAQSDAFDSVNALFAGLAFAGLIMAILLQSDQLRQQTEQLILQREEIALQRADLALQREEMRLQREEMKRASDAQENAEKALRKRLEFEQDQQKKRLTLALYQEWQSAEMIAVRHEIEKYLFTPNFMIQVTLSRFAKENRVEYRHFVQVLRYLEKATLLARLDQIESSILANLLGSDVAWAYQNIVTHFSLDKEDRSDLKKLIKTVRESELAKWAG